MFQLIKNKSKQSWMCMSKKFTFRKRGKNVSFALVFAYNKKPLLLQTVAGVGPTLLT